MLGGGGVIVNWALPSGALLKGAFLILLEMVLEMVMEVVVNEDTSGDSEVLDVLMKIVVLIIVEVDNVIISDQQHKEASQSWPLFDPPVQRQQGGDKTNEKLKMCRRILRCVCSCHLSPKKEQYSKMRLTLLLRLKMAGSSMLIISSQILDRKPSD